MLRVLAASVRNLHMLAVRRERGRRTQWWAGAVSTSFCFAETNMPASSYSFYEGHTKCLTEAPLLFPRMFRS